MVVLSPQVNGVMASPRIPADPFECLHDCSPSVLLRRAGECGSTGEGLLPIRELVLGAEHPRVVTTRNSLAYWTLKADGDTKADVDQVLDLTAQRLHTVNLAGQQLAIPGG